MVNFERWMFGARFFFSSSTRLFFVTHMFDP